jgi:N-acetylmuramoyl-L-alanine amidase
MKRKLYGAWKVYDKIKVIQFRYIVLFSLAGIIFFLCPVWAERPPVKQLVIIDPAHGGTDKGVKLSDKEYEKDIALKIALQLQKELQAKKDIRVQLTRATDRDMSISERIKVVRAAGARVFVSLHINAAFGKDATGYELYFPGFNIASSEKNATAEILRDMATNKYLNESVALAQSIRQNLQNVFPGKDRQLRDAPTLILEGLTLPAVMVEIGFATSREDKIMLIDEKSQQAIAQALSKGIIEFLHVN